MEKKIEEYSKHLEELVKKRTEQLTEAQAQLVKSERLAAIGQLAGMVGHDLRNPLTVIKTANYQLKKKYANSYDARTNTMMNAIDNAIEHANRIVTELLDYSREIRLGIAKCSPKTLLQNALAMIQIPNPVKIMNHTQNEPTMKTDNVKIERVFINLIKNAIDAMPDKGTLEISSKQIADNVEISFTDTGMGITKEVMAKLFMPLFTTKPQGMGFGLAICKRVVEAHSGKITVESTVDKGTTFTVTIPVEPKTAKTEIPVQLSQSK
jgi:signal transduction histidine kinase